MMNHDTHPPPLFSKFFPYPLPIGTGLFSDRYLFSTFVCLFIFSFVVCFWAYCGVFGLVRS